MLSGCGARKRWAFLTLAIFSVTLLLLSRGHKDDLWSDTLREDWRTSEDQDVQHDLDHPIARLMREADQLYDQVNSNVSQRYAEAVDQYRSCHTRHPPPNFDKWYRFARKRGVRNIDSFFLPSPLSSTGIHADLRPFWALRPSVIRHRAAHAADDPGWGLTVVSVRGGALMVKKGQRGKALIAAMKDFVQWLPDMDIPLNLLDTPRILMRWEHVQGWLRAEEEGRRLLPSALVSEEFTKDMTEFRTMVQTAPSQGILANSWNPFWFPSEHGVGPYSSPPEYKWSGRESLSWAVDSLMDLLPFACPPNSHARIANDDSLRHAEQSYKSEDSYLIHNFNLSTDICTAGPQLSRLHSVLTTRPHKLVHPSMMMPVFSEFKLSVNNDILIPSLSEGVQGYPGETHDVPWHHKNSELSWRGDTGGGIIYRDHLQLNDWSQFLRQRVVAGAALAQREEQNRTEAGLVSASSPFSVANHSDIAFTAINPCEPDCIPYRPDLFSALRQPKSLKQHLQSRFVLALDGVSPDVQFPALLRSASLPFRATIFRQWHDTRLIPWRDYVPLDVGNVGYQSASATSNTNSGNLWDILAHFIGHARAIEDAAASDEGQRKIRGSHDIEAAKIAHQGARTAGTTIRREDMEVYLFLLLIEYGRLIDDNREYLGITDHFGKLNTDDLKQ